MRAALSLLLTLLAAHPSLAQDKMSREDKAAILFSNRFSFTDDGEPVLPVGIMDQQSTITVSAKGGLIIHPSGPDGPEVRLSGNHKWVFSVKEPKPAKLAWRAVLGEVPTKDFPAVKETAANWEMQGFQTIRLELGTLFSFQGTVFDSRVTLLCAAELFTSRKAANAFLSALPGGRTDSQRVAEVLDARPEGQVLLKERESGITIEARNAIWFEPQDGLITVHDVEYARGFPWHGRQTRTYGGSFYVAVDKTGQLAIANVLPAETMLRGLVPAEIYPDAPDAALQAQAISARNELYSKIGHRHLADPYLICSEQDCQVYKGKGAEKKRTNRAVKQTRGEVIFDENGKLADIRYSSTCGGHTEDGNEAWAGVNSPNLRGRYDTAEGARSPVTEADVESFLTDPPTTYCGRSSRSRSTFRWTKTIPGKELDGLVKKQHRIGQVEEIEVLHRGVSGRANKLRIKGSKGEIVVNGELTIRRLFGGLKSSLFVIKKNASSAWEFKGGGFGHGVGMCQIGAMEMARDGKDSTTILEFYYKGISVKRIY
jgi:stage II sporulation protein D